MGNNFKIVAKTLFGFEEILSKELGNLGASNVVEGTRSVSFEGDSGFMYKANLCLRTAIKIIKPINSFQVRDEKDLYRKIYNTDWTEYMSIHNTFAIDSTVNSEQFAHSLYLSQKTKDAIVDKFRDTDGERPNVDVKHPDRELIFIYITIIVMFLLIALEVLCTIDWLLLVGGGLTAEAKMVGSWRSVLT